MEQTKISDFIGKRVTVWLLGQSQLSISPGLKTDGTLMGVDQGIYIIKLDKEDLDEILLIPVGQCRLAVKRD